MREFRAQKSTNSTFLKTQKFLQSLHLEWATNFFAAQTDGQTISKQNQRHFCKQFYQIACVSWSKNSFASMWILWIFMSLTRARNIKNIYARGCRRRQWIFNLNSNSTAGLRWTFCCFASNQTHIWIYLFIRLFDLVPMENLKVWKSLNKLWNLIYSFSSSYFVWDLNKII